MLAEGTNSSGSSFDVFLSFHGRDTRHEFADHLYDRMTDEGISVFRDSESLHHGRTIGGELLQAIEQSNIYIPIFSKNYASSKWCLRELTHMVECTDKSNGNKKILPIFLDVEPDDVKLKTSLYCEALSKLHEKRSNEAVESWRKALREVGRMYGWYGKNFTRKALSDGVISALIEVGRIKERSRKKDERKALSTEDESALIEEQNRKKGESKALSKHHKKISTEVESPRKALFEVGRRKGWNWKKDESKPLLKHLKKISTEVESGRNALIKVGQIKGCNWTKNESQVDFIRSVIKIVLAMRNKGSKKDEPEHLVGGDHQLEAILKKSPKESNSAWFLALLGMGGIGRILADKVIFNLYPYFGGCNFLLPYRRVRTRSWFGSFSEKFLIQPAAGNGVHTYPQGRESGVLQLQGYKFWLANFWSQASTCGWSGNGVPTYSQGRETGVVQRKDWRVNFWSPENIGCISVFTYAKITPHSQIYPSSLLTALSPLSLSPSLFPRPLSSATPVSLLPFLSPPFSPFLHFVLWPGPWPAPSHSEGLLLHLRTSNLPRHDSSTIEVVRRG